MKKILPAVLFSTVLLVSSQPLAAQLTYDSSHDPWKDFSIAQKEAKLKKLNILIDIGGDWCIDCRHLDEFFNSNTQLKDYLLKSFIVLKVYEGSERDNSDFLSQLPRTGWVPSLFVVRADGKILEVMDARKLAAGNTYDPKKMQAFLSKWGLKK
ncbi:thioredoxin family protein [Deinococcus ruber]|uniref:Thioredoxin family protein n=1 Tax=Deinococcus ruber TaxID=1848197 RepID=A0A918BY87_9DEIO|nr:thioredoxin family protein [Deinococcus ruber]GGQ94820.1 hypothetical protein GCM10008957_03810 [Deinococcus ruber]